MKSDNTPVFNPWNSFYESPEEQEAIKERAKIRDAMKAEYRKRYTNPFKPPLGFVHDPALQRQFSAQVTFAEFLRPSPKLGLIAAGFFGTITLVVVAKKQLLKYSISDFENGEVTYRTRWGGNLWW
ncbi:hypothetical protein EWB00_002681 [Schistosoma japonicum]|uniref:NADH dehydrogenase [ubiquinone] 1 beta subcomplex subunit 4 n=1 Tax=Schistosoma japonicum TaxID=6182 RepID=Q86FD0_SCHJA|nr:SJCHGC06741 protein [Schistosoma japonicum]KAH8868768.1 NADH dehydrogenase ubiquinone 1 beta [Schistosoma japonicum]TNN13751.1 hypothetical protein EWB00_002681 [Schistosoma japonicum]CAX74925.1 hypothetical protein [Schistosoma japonicum]